MSFFLRPSWSLRNAAVALVALLGTVIALVVVPLIEERIRHDTREAVGEEQALRALQVARMIDLDIAARLADIQARAAGEQIFLMRADPARMRAWLDTIQAGFPEYGWIGMTDLEGKVLAATGGMLTGLQVHARPWFSAGLKGAAVLDVHDAKLMASKLPPDQGAPVRFIDVTVPLRDADGRTVGVLGAHLYEHWLRGRLQLLQGMLADVERDIVVVGPDDRPRLRPRAEKEEALALESVRRARSGPGGWLVERWPDGQRYVVGYARHAGTGPFEGLGWVTLVRQPADIDPPAVTTAIQAVRTGAMITLLAAVLATLGLTTLALRPLHVFERRLQAGPERGDETDLDTLRLPAWSARELVSLADTIRDLLARLARERRRLAQAYAELDASFHGVGAQFPGVLFTAEVQDDGRARFRFVSPSCERYLGLDAAALLRDGGAWADHVHPEDRSALRTGIAESAREGERWEARFRVTGGDGTERWLYAQATQRRDDEDGRPVWDGLALDITPLVQERARAEAADAAKGEFLATMSHELRTPLNGITGYAALIELDAATPAQREHARALREAGDMLTRILNDVLDFSKIEAGRLRLEDASFAPAALLADVAGGWGAQCAARGLQFALDVPAEPWPMLRGDPVRLRQVLDNLLSNACKFTTEGRISLVARHAPADDGRVLLQVTVADTGIGMDAGQRERLFRRFEQAEVSTARRFGGTGLGLSIVKGLVDAMGGEINCDSAPGVGTRFELVLPLVRAGAADAAPTAAATTAERPLRVLVADDIALNRRVISALLTRRGHEVVEAADGEQALARYAESRIDLVLMDLDMPVMDGLESTRRLRASGLPGARTVPVHALTGNVFAEDRSRAREAGMDGLLDKPVRHEALLALLAEVGAPEAVEVR